MLPPHDLPLPRAKSRGRARGKRSSLSLVPASQTEAAKKECTLPHGTHHQLAQYIDDKKLLSKFQSGYRKFHSCETAILKIHNDLLLMMDKQNESGSLHSLAERGSGVHESWLFFGSPRLTRRKTPQAVRVPAAKPIAKAVPGSINV